MVARTPRHHRASSGADPYAEAFKGAAERYDVSEEYLRKMAFLESSGNPDARRGSSRGLMQFQPAAAREVGLRDPYDPVASIYGAAKLAAKNRDYLTGRLGRDPTESELYFAHQQGRYGAAKILENPDRMAAAVLAEFHRKPARVITVNGGHTAMDCKNFSGLWDRKYNEAQPLGQVADKNIRVDPDFAAVARGEKPPGAAPGYSDNRRQTTATVARDVFGPSTMGDGYYPSTEPFNNASARTRPSTNSG